MQRTITIKSKGTVTSRPDLATVIISIENKEKVYKETVEGLNKEVNHLTALLESIKVSKKEIKTTDFNVRTDYENTVDETGRYKNQFVGYVATQTIKINLPFKNDRLSQILETISTSQLIARLDINLSVKDKEKLVDEILIDATKNAFHKAEVLSKASKLELGKIISIEHKINDIDFYSRTQLNVRSTAQSSDFALNIEPEDIHITEYVDFVFEIK